MKKLALVLFMILALTGMAFADSDSHDVTNTQSQGIGSGNTQNGAGASMSILSPSATGGAGGAGGAGGSVTNTQIGGTFSPTFNVNKDAIKNTNDNTNLNVNTNVFDPKNTFNPTNTNIQGQKQSQKQQQQQGQFQGQSQNNKQTIAPVQQVLFESPTPLLNTPSQSVPELNFGNGRMIDATKGLPNFAIFGIKPLGAEPIREVLSVNANVKFKKLYQAVLDDAKDVANGGKKTLTDVRYQIIRAEGQKSWTTGGNLGGAGSALSASGLSGASGAGSIVPQWGGTKADDLFTIIFVKVAL
jgi:hypothetical protein